MVSQMERKYQNIITFITFSVIVQCTNSKQPYKIGDTFSVKTPGKSADIVLLVDQSQKNEAVYKDFVQPLVQQLNQEFNTKGVR